MIDVLDFHSELQKNNINFYCGVPDSLMKEYCDYLASLDSNYITANEGSAIALAAGHHLGTNNTPLVYMQNSGLGNATNPILSLIDKNVYSIPMIILIGWRGEPGIKDEPQHISQGKCTIDLLKSMGITYETLKSDSDFKYIIKKTLHNIKTSEGPSVILVSKGAFKNTNINYKIPENNFELTREEALEIVMDDMPEKSIIVSTTGKLSRELYEYRVRNNQNKKNHDFLTVGSMGHSLQIAIGIALSKPNLNIYCFDGDGSALMHLGNYAIAGSINPQNLKIILFNNGSHESVGGQPTIGHSIDFGEIAKNFKITSLGNASNSKSIKEKLNEMKEQNSISFMNILTSTGSRKNLGRPKKTPKESKREFMQTLDSYD